MYIGIWNIGLQAFQDAWSRFAKGFFFFFFFFSFFIRDVSLLKSSTNHQQICSSFYWTQTTLQKHLQIPTYKTHYTSLKSHHVCKLCSCLFMPERKKNNLQINKEKKNHVYRDVYCLSDCSLKKIVQKHMVTTLIASYSSINIL